MQDQNDVHLIIIYSSGQHSVPPPQAINLNEYLNTAYF